VTRTLTHPDTGEELGFRPAWRLAFRTNPVGTNKQTIAAVMVVVFGVLHLFLWDANGKVWHLAALPVLPVASWHLLRGWVFVDDRQRLLGWVLAVAGTMLPFLLP
jgi:hypothetical protein